MGTVRNSGTRHSPRRRPKQGGYARGDETRAHIVETALGVFGKRGFDFASTRSIATKAGVKPPALQYYLGSKEGLHRACADYIIAHSLPSLLPAIESARISARERDRTAAVKALDLLLDALIDSLSESHMAKWGAFFMRGKRDGAGPGIEIIRQQLRMSIADAMGEVLAVITGTPASDEMRRLRTLLVLGQIYWMHAGLSEAREALGWPTLNEAEVARVKQTVREHPPFSATNATVADTRFVLTCCFQRFKTYSCEPL